MSKTIFSINYEIPGHSDLDKGFSSKSSLMDADILVFNPDEPDGHDSDYQGKPSYNDRGSFQYREDTEHWKKELSSFLKTGRTVFLLLKEKESFFLKTGTQEYKPKVTINHVSGHHNYEFLPINIGTITTAKGSAVDFSGHSLFVNFFKHFKNNLKFQVYLENANGSTVIFTGKDKAKILGAIFKVGEGHLVVLPYLDYSENKFVAYKKDKTGEEVGYWTKEAIKFGNILISCLIEIDEGLTQESIKTPPPQWVSDEKFVSNKELEIVDVVKKNTEKIKNIEADNSQLQIKLQEEAVMKDLLYEQGKPLENAVIKALQILGYNAENYNDGELELDQVIVSPEGPRYIGECEGKDNKDIDITKFRQLLESMSADFAREEVEEKAYGILFGNAQRLIDPISRTLDFTQKCKIGASREKIALIKTSNLFDICLYLKTNADETFKKQCRDAIYNGLGGIVKFPDLPLKEEIK